jgi:4-diphosphocytidyl-2-C-methyl-D-erythritol kinase
VNLFLHVGAPAPDGYHPVCSLMVFANVGDTVRFIPGGEGLTVDGAFASGLAGEGNNLVLRARDALLAMAGGHVGFRLVLEKTLPIAAGLGGGSSDAAAALKLIRDALELPVDDEGLREIAGTLGADGPACLDATAVIGEGRGDVLTPPPPFPSLPAVLANPGVASPTGPVYRAYDAAVSAQGANSPEWPQRLDTPAEVVAFLARCRNDLEAPAIALAPKIGECLETLSAQPESLLARMSGSGATCFAVCADAAAAQALADRLTAERPHWWVRACVFGGR